MEFPELSKEFQKKTELDQSNCKGRPFEHSAKRSFGSHKKKRTKEY